MTATNIIPLLDGPLYGDSCAGRQQMVAQMAAYIIEIDCVENDCDAFRALMHSGRYNITLAALCFADAAYLAQHIMVAREMGLE